MRKFYFFLIIVLALPGCTTTVFLERIVPPDIVPACSPASVALINTFNYVQNPHIKEKHVIAFKTGIEAFAQTMTAYKSEDLTFRQNPEDTLWKPGMLCLDPDGIVMTDTIVGLIGTHLTNHLLLIDTMEIWLDWETLREEEMDGSVSKRKDFYLSASYFLSLYDSTGSLVKRTVLDKSMLYKSRPTLSGLITIVPNLANARDEIAFLAREAGLQYIGMFYDQILKEPRTLYAGKMFASSNQRIQRKEYDVAISQLGELTSHPKKKWRLRAEHNLSVARELKAAGQLISTP